MINVNGLILSAGQSKRMGPQNKALSKLCGRTLIQHVIHRLEPQVDKIMISGENEVFGHLPYDIIEDVVGLHRGPLM